MERMYEHVKGSEEKEGAFGGGCRTDRRCHCEQIPRGTRHDQGREEKEELTVDDIAGVDLVPFCERFGASCPKKREEHAKGSNSHSDLGG
jgi:hypothetical protein